MTITDGALMGDTAPATEIPEADTSISSEPLEAAPQEPVEAGDFYSVKVDGAEQQVTLDELRSGYSRQQDYTKKTQELAEQRKQLAQYEALANALDTDPIGTLKALNEAFNVSDQDAQSEWDQMDPQEQRIVKLEQELQAQRARDARSTIDKEFSALEAEFGELDRQQVANFALRNKLTVTDAYRVMNFDTVRTEAKKWAEEAKVVDSKRGLPPATGGAQKGAIAPASSGKVMTARESILAALKEAKGH